MKSNAHPSRGGAAADTEDVSRRARSAPTRRIPPLGFGIALALALACIAVASVRFGSTEALELDQCGRAMLALLGLGEPLAGHAQVFFELHLWRVLVTIGVGAGLSLSGAYLQGVFRNGLASPSILGISSGAMVGASLAVLLVGGYGPGGVAEIAAGSAPLVVSALGFVGALAVACLVMLLATRDGRVSVPTLLLVGIAVNACLGGVLAAIQSLALRHDFEIARSIFAWTFGSLADRSGTHAAIVWSGIVLAALAIPFVALELDLFAAGEDDAHALGVDTARVKLTALFAASLAAGVAVAVAGQIAFVGLVVPHLLRLMTGTSHRSLLPLCLVGGPVLLLGADLLQRALLGSLALQPGVTMSLIGGPFFLFLLARNRSSLRSW